MEKPNNSTSHSASANTSMAGWKPAPPPPPVTPHYNADAQNNHHTPASRTSSFYSQRFVLFTQCHIMHGTPTYYSLKLSAHTDGQKFCQCRQSTSLVLCLHQQYSWDPRAQISASTYPARATTRQPARPVRQSKLPGGSWRLAGGPHGPSPGVGVDTPHRRHGEDRE